MPSCQTLAILVLLASATTLSTAEPQQQRQQQQQRGEDCSSFGPARLDVCSYQPHRELLARLRLLERRHPNLVRTASLGRSVEGRDIAYVKISSNVRYEYRQYSLIESHCQL